jgi:DNA-binding NtrC family response regulator
VAELETLSKSRDDREPASVPPAPYLFVLLECDRPLGGSSRHSLADLDRVEIGRAEERTFERRDRALIIGIPDLRMSQPHLRLTRRDGRWVAEDAASKNGMIVDGQQRGRVTLADGVLLELGHTLLLYREAPPSDGPTDVAASDLAELPPGFRTLAPAFARDLVDLTRVARGGATVFLHGPSGCGKELIARGLHVLAQRPGKLVAINCGAVPGNLVESELFGVRKGAFSGADQDRLGLVRSADRGTLFLDEIADLPLASQAALLRVLQEREVTPVGATQAIPIDVLVVAASHRDLAAQVERHEFRHDLYARLAAYTFELPPLAERREDLGLLLQTMLPRLTDEPVRISCSAASALHDHDWPLNMRELENCLRIAVARCGGQAIKLEHLPATLRDDEPEASAAELSPDQRAHRDSLIAQLREHTGNVSAIARATGKARMQIQRWLRKYKLDAADYR